MHASVAAMESGYEARVPLLEDKKLRILVLDDFALNRRALRIVLAEAAKAHVVEAATIAEAMTQFRKSQLDIVLLSSNFCESNGLGLIKTFRDLWPSLKVLVLSERLNASLARRSLALGAAGCISLSTSTQELADAIETIAQGKIYLEPEIATKLALRQVFGEADIYDGLTARECEILRLIGEGKDLSSISVLLGVAYKTVANGCTQIKMKLDVTCMAELVKVACENSENWE
ncbi:MAG: response regulator transcription factor [Proteobacteria bacterium]|nr:response regulator transcription factor [Pseudomonadota bacterium]